MCANSLFHVASIFFHFFQLWQVKSSTHCPYYFYMNTVDNKTNNIVYTCTHTHKHTHICTVLDKEGERRREADPETARLSFWIIHICDPVTVRVNTHKPASYETCTPGNLQTPFHSQPWIFVVQHDWHSGRNPSQDHHMACPGYWTIPSGPWWLVCKSQVLPWLPADNLVTLPTPERQNVSSIYVNYIYL